MGGIRVSVDGGLSPAGARRHHHRAGLARCRSAGARATGPRAAAGARAGRAAAVVLLGRVRAGGHRPARRQARDHALALRRAAGAGLSAHRRGARRALRRRGQPADGGRQRRPASISACTSSAATGGRPPPTAWRAAWSCRPHRDGGQAQFIEAPVPAAQGRGAARAGARPPARRARRAIPASPAWRSAAGMSRRTFLRRFKASTGADARRLAGAGAAGAGARAAGDDAPGRIEDVATAAGFGSAANLRHHFRKELKVSPSDFRRRFGSPAA